MRNSPSCGCCYCERCRVAFDDFDRSDSSSLGVDWIETAGDWEILSNSLATDDVDALAIWDEDDPHGYPAQVVTAKLKGEDVGDQLRVIIAYTDQDNYLAAEITIGDGATCGEFRLFEMAAGFEVDVSLEISVSSLVADVWHTLKVCYYYDGGSYGVGRMAAELTTASGVKVYTSGVRVVSGLRVGLGTGAVTTRSHFDNFCWQRHSTAEVVSGYGAEPNCPDCLNRCQFSQDYLAAVGTDTGCAWQECSGDWEVEDSGGGVLAATIDTAPAELLHRVPQPFGLPYQRVTVEVKLEDVGDIARVLVDRSTCAATTSAAGVEIEAGTNCGVMRLVNAGVSGPDIPVIGLVPDVWHMVEVCYGYGYASDAYTNTLFTARVTPHNSAAVQSTDEYSGGGQYASLASVAVTSKIWFRNFSSRMSYRSPESPQCEPCNGTEGWCVWGSLDCDAVDECRWTDVSGSWTCGTTSSDDALKRFEVEQPQKSNRQRVTGTVTHSGEATSAIYIAYEDSPHHMALRITTGGACPKAELIEDGVVLRTVEDSRIVAGAAVAFCVMFDGTELTAWYEIGGVGSEPIYLEATATGHVGEGYKAALGTGTVTTGTVTFSSVVLWVAKSAHNSDCDDCDVCYLWHAAETLAGGAAFQGTAGASLSCEYGGTAVYGTVNDQALGTSVEAAIVPAGGSMSFDIGTDDGETVAYVSFYLTARPAVLTVTSCGVAAVLTVASNGTATLAVAGGTATSISVVAVETQYTLKLCSFGAESRALVLDGDWRVSGASFGSAIGSGTVNGSTVTIAAATNDIAVRSVGVTRHLKNDGETSCGECEPFCDVCENNQMPSQILVEFEGCSGVFLPDLGCCSLNGAWFVTMGACGGVLEWTDDQGDKRIEVELTDHTTYVAVRVYWEHYESGFGGALIGSGEWGADLPKPVDCLQFSRQELAIDAGVVSASDPVCETSLTGTQCFISAA